MLFESRDRLLYSNWREDLQVRVVGALMNAHLRSVVGQDSEHFWTSKHCPGG